MDSERDRAPEYRQHAKACLELAERMSPGPERARILEMAQQWLDLASKVVKTRNPQCPKCQIEMYFFNRIETSDLSDEKRPVMRLYECIACGRMTAEAA
jgi:hypothetical protein